MTADQVGEMVVHGDDHVVRDAAVRVGNQLRRNADHARTQLTIADVP
jgi:hypothetical protein